MERIPFSGEAYDPISMTTIMKTLTEKNLTKFPGEGCTVTVCLYLSYLTIYSSDSEP
jgi:hypothetical protein